jgi:hypothetical protein
VSEVAELLHALLAEVRGLRAEFAEQRAAAPLADRALAAIDGVLGAEPFDAGRLLALARERVPGRARLRAVVVEVVRDLDAPGAGRRLGRWLAQHVGYATASCEFRLENPHETRNGAAYRVVHAAEVATETRAAHRWP